MLIASPTEHRSSSRERLLNESAEQPHVGHLRDRVEDGAHEHRAEVRGSRAFWMHASDRRANREGRLHRLQLRSLQLN